MSQPPPRRGGPDDRAVIEALQQAAYARNREQLGVEPLPLLADYASLLASHEFWLLDGAAAPRGLLVLEKRPKDLLIWSVAASPVAQGQGVGTRLLDFAEVRARQLNRSTLRLYTGEKLIRNIAWYERHGYAVEEREVLADRVLIHMVKTIS
ncbi:GNAT family N-acetyltransferase [Kaistia terrae]|uniref:GNAT family N-acetyltransferase n=1 Tax=Kaistia terrae TaxID=537017 RepID=A0ABW0PUX2_9HYPH|nr:GNAT family N-acetyltransferase [Kaistia terrae]MCX5579993.1 GNAT family N-acetyltransferase [Kaistia terrae]